MIKTITHKGPLRVVTFADLELWTNRGWQLVAMYQESGLSTMMESVQDEHPQGDGSYGTVLCTRHVPSSDAHTNTFFILAQDEESALADMATTIESLEALNKAEMEARMAAEKLAKSLSDDISEREALIERQGLDIDSIHKAHAEAIRLKNRMEDDIAKLRKQFGEKAINEALAVEE